MTAYPKYINPAYRQAKPFLRSLVDLSNYFGYKQRVGAYPIFFYVGLMVKKYLRFVVFLDVWNLFQQSQTPRPYLLHHQGRRI